MSDYMTTESPYIKKVIVIDGTVGRDEFSLPEEFDAGTVQLASGVNYPPEAVKRDEKALCEIVLLKPSSIEMDWSPSRKWERFPNLPPEFVRAVRNNGSKKGWHWEPQ